MLFLTGFHAGNHLGPAPVISRAFSNKRNARGHKHVVGYSILGVEATYHGTKVNGVPHGKGVLTSVKGALYKGEVTSGVPSGRGKLITEAGAIIEGQFKYGVAKGSILILYPNEVSSALMVPVEAFSTSLREITRERVSLLS